MSLDPITAGIDLVSGIVSRIWPDASADEQAKLVLALQQDKDFAQLMTAQVNANAAEAANPNMFVSGWRPFIGWVCGLAMAWVYMVEPIIVFIGSASGHPITNLPTFNSSDMMNVLFGMLGMGGLRTFEKVKGVARTTLQE